MTKLSKEDLGILVDTNIDENLEQGATGTELNEILIDITDSMAEIDAPVEVFSFRIRQEDLDEYDSVSFEHELDNTDLKIVLYDHRSRRIYREYYDFEIIDSSNIKITILEGIPYNKYWEGYVYKIA